jgi:predicted nucleic acid-binding protein
MASFVDTTIFVYAFSVTVLPRDAGKPEIARTLIQRLIRTDELVVSTQVLGELYVNLIRGKKPLLSRGDAAEVVHELAKYSMVDTDLALVSRAIDRTLQSLIHYFDALMVEAAIQAGTTILYSEDMHHGTRYGTLEIRNPFL